MPPAACPSSSAPDRSTGCRETSPTRASDPVRAACRPFPATGYARTTVYRCGTVSPAGRSHRPSMARPTPASIHARPGQLRSCARSSRPRWPDHGSGRRPPSYCWRFRDRPMRRSSAVAREAPASRDPPGSSHSAAGSRPDGSSLPSGGEAGPRPPVPEQGKRRWHIRRNSRLGEPRDLGHRGLPHGRRR